MKLKSVELLEDGAAVRLFPSKLVQIGSDIRVRDKHIKVERMDQDALGNVWINKGLYVMASASLAYVVPEDAEAEWEKCFVAEQAPDTRCPDCEFVSADMRGLSAHRRAKHQ